MNCAVCNAVDASSYRPFWKAVPCAAGVPVSGRGQSIEQRVCQWCSRPFCVNRHQPHRYCGADCRREGRIQASTRGLICQSGRWYITCRDGSYLAFYRGLVEAELGRSLSDAEVVHHINGDPSDDRIENLQVLTRAEHMAIHRQELEEARRLKRDAA